VNPIPEIDVTDVGARAEDGMVVLDVREPDEWSLGRIAGSLHVPMGELRARQDELPTDRPLVVVCRSGNRSAIVVGALLDAGYDAVNLAGGLQAWAGAGLPLVAEGGAPGTVA
jgi:rhodanese-related sulfurtransferase